MAPNDFFGALYAQYQNQRPLVVYRKPKDPAIKALLQQDAVLYHPSNYTESGFVFAPFDDKNPAVLIPVSNSKSIQTDAEISHENVTTKQMSNRRLEQKQSHVALVQKGIEAIKTQGFLKVVLSRCELVDLENAEPFRIFKNLLKAYPTAFVYCFFHPEIGLWLGATPETLLKIDGHRLTTMSLAGTQKYNGTLDVVWGQKEREEQQFVTDFIVRSLSANEVQVSETETVRAGNLLHLKTEIGVRLKPETFRLKHILHDLHPTPAVCGFPKAEAKQFILNTEDYDREYYTGFLGELNLKEHWSRNSNRHNVENDAYRTIRSVSNLYVNLRCMQLRGGQAFIYVGGGITKDSIAEDEWDETVAKSQVIKSIL